MSGNLSALHVSKNFLTGGIPASWGKLQKLTILDVRNNQLNGSGPAELGNFINLVVFLANNNMATSPQLWPTSTSGRFALDHNELTGSIPPQLASKTQVTAIDLSGNQLTGSIPPLTSTLLTYFNVSESNLTGTIPIALGSSFGNSSFAGNLGLCGPPLAACSQPVRSHHSGLGTGAIVGITLGSVATTTAVLLLLLSFFRRRHGFKLLEEEPGKLEHFTYDNIATPESQRRDDTWRGGLRQGTALTDYVDATLRPHVEEEQGEMVGMLKAGLLCTSFRASQRPDMRDVLSILENIEAFGLSTSRTGSMTPCKVGSVSPFMMPHANHRRHQNERAPVYRWACTPRSAATLCRDARIQKRLDWKLGPES
eukprot:SM000020S06006  [mRNA]  locus=s20:363647:367703:- [translate_table: standard]